MDIKQLAKENKDYVISMRRHFHEYPELSFEEYETSKKIKEELDKMGIEYVSAAGTGVIATIKGGKPGKTVALRADIDGLPVQELTDFEYKSKVEGRMHACGHDTHAAMLLGAAKILNEIKDEINGTVRLLFQPSEENGKGAFAMIKDGAVDGVDGIFGIHIWADVPVGKVSLEAGPRMACADWFHINVHGKGGHGSQPEQCIDAVVVSSAIVMNLQTLVSRENRPQSPLVLTVGMLNSGSRFNVIAEDGYMEGTTRCFDPEFRKQLPVKMERIIKNTAEAFGATASLDFDFAVAPTINDPKCAEIGQGSVEKILGKKGNYQFEKLTGGEDFSHYLEKVPGAIAFVGCRNEEKNCCYAHHNGRFAIDEDALEIGTALYAQYAVDFLDKFEK
ncbi:M20 family metallopeptidase [Intestinibacter sp.]